MDLVGLLFSYLEEKINCVGRRCCITTLKHLRTTDARHKKATCIIMHGCLQWEKLQGINDGTDAELGKDVEKDFTISCNKCFSTCLPGHCYQDRISVKQKINLVWSSLNR